MAGIEVRNATWDNAAGSPSCNATQNCEPTIVQFAQGTHVSLQDMYMHGLQSNSTTLAGADGARFLGVTSNSSGEIGNSVVNDADAAYTCTESGPDVSICGWGSEGAFSATTVHDVVGAFNEWQIAGALTVNKWTIYGTTTSSVGGHSDLVYLLTGPNTFISVTNGLWYDNEKGALSQINAYSGGTYNFKGNNCPEFCGTNGSSFNIDATCAGNCGGTNPFIFNMALNTINAVTGTCMTMGGGGTTYADMALNMYDNFCITTAATMYTAASTQPNTINGITSPTNSTAASANYKPTTAPAGLTVANFFTPQLTTDPPQGSVFLGTNLTLTLCVTLPDFCAINEAPGATNAPFTLPTSGNTFPAGTAEIGSGGGSVALTPASQNFGSINTGSSSSPVTFTVTNGSASSLTLGSPFFSLSGANPADFGATAGTCTNGGTVAASGSCTFTVTFTPGALGSRSATLSVSYTGGDGASPQTSALSGTGVAPPAGAPTSRSLQLTLLLSPLPLPAPVPTAPSGAPTGSYFTSKGFSQDNVTWTSTFNYTASGSNLNLVTGCALDAIAVPCSCVPASCVLTIPTTAAAIPSVAKTPHTISLFYPAAAAIPKP